MADTLHDRIKHSFKNQPMMATLGAQIVEIDQGRVVIEAPILPGARQHQGHGHAGLTFSIGDTAAGYAAQTVMPENTVVVTAEIKINLTAPARGDRLRAVGRVVKPGRRLVVVTAEVFAIEAEKEVLIAVMQGTMAPVQI